jgi:hypothetical protein
MVHIDPQLLRCQSNPYTILEKLTIKKFLAWIT